MNSKKRAFRQSKWNWDPHLKKMDDLYNSGLKITKIAEAIHCDGFQPRERTVYAKFKALGYPTDHDRVLRPGHAGPPQDREADGPFRYHRHLPMSMGQSSVPRAAICVPIEDETQTATTEDSGMNAVSIATQKLKREDRRGYHTALLQEGQVIDNTMVDHNVLDSPRNLEKEVINDATFGMPTSAIPIAEKLLPSSILQSKSAENLKINPTQQRKRRKSSNTPEQEIIIENLREAGLLSRLHHTGGRRKQSARGREGSDCATDARPPSDVHPMGRIRSMLDVTRHPFRARARRESPFADNNDSGYFSGRVTPSTRQSRDSPLTSHSASLSEFQGLHRAACYTLHEPPDSHLSGEIHNCHFCGYSRIHSLAWSANQIMLENFEAELNSYRLDDLRALDAAGNSALHYAAFSGASYAHLKALVDAGVPLYRQNTANQNFLHCLRPCPAKCLSHSVDCYKLGLIKLLELVEPRIALSQQDNDGQTVLHVLALHITEPELRARTFKFFKDNGFRWTVLNRFGKSAMDISSAAYQYGQTMIASDTFNTKGTSSVDIESLSMSEWQKDLLKVMNANNLLVEAHKNPHCVDSTTRDTILHALSRLNVQSGGSMQSHDIIRYLQQFVAEGVSLNRHNGDGHHPLSAFICNKDFRGSETGATMARYIDILLGKGCRHPKSNDINIDMMNRSGATALFEAAVHAQSDTVRSLIEAGANVNARLSNDPKGLSILQATIAARNKAVVEGKDILHHDFKNVISHLEHAGAVAQPTSLEERGRST